MFSEREKELAKQLNSVGLHRLFVLGDFYLGNDGVELYGMPDLNLDLSSKVWLPDVKDIWELFIKMFGLPGRDWQFCLWSRDEAEIGCSLSCKKVSAVVFDLGPVAAMYHLLLKLLSLFPLSVTGSRVCVVKSVEIDDSQIKIVLVEGDILMLSKEECYFHQRLTAGMLLILEEDKMTGELSKLYARIPPLQAGGEFSHTHSIDNSFALVFAKGVEADV